MQVKSGKNKRPQKVVIYGPEGIGKSTLAMQFPNPLFFDIDQGSDTLDVHRYDPRPLSWEMLASAMQDFKNDTQGYQTMVIDTADKAETLCVQNIVSAASLTGIEDFGYGKGYVYLYEKFGKFLNYASSFLDLGINVVFIAHAICRKFDLPEESGSFDKWEMKLEKKTMPLLKEWADMLLFMNYKTTIVENTEKKKKAIGGKRVIYTSHHPCWDAKNRHGLPDEIPADFSAIAHCIPLIGAEGSPTRDLKKDTNETQKITKTDPKEPENIEKTVKNEEKQQNYYEGIIPELAQLMKHNNVTKEEIQQVVAQRGYYPADTDITVYAETFVRGAIIAGWKKVHEMILENRKNGGK